MKGGPRRAGARRRSAAAAVLGLGLVSLAAGSGVAVGEGTGFVAVATAAGARLTYTVPNFAAVESVADAGGPLAQALVDSAGGAQAFSALPYPGETVLAGPGLFATATGVSLPSGTPAYVSAQHPARPEEVSADPSGTYSLAARARAGRADGDAAAGPVSQGDRPSGARSIARAEVDDQGDLRVEARSTMSGLTFGGGTLRIATVVAEAAATQEPGAAAVARSALRLEGATVNGVGVTFGPDGLGLLGNPVPLPPAEARRAVAEALAQAGLRVVVVDGAPVPGGVQSDTLEITSTSGSPAPGVPAATTTFRFGGAVVAITSGAGLPALPLPGETDPGPGGDSGTEGPTGPAGLGPGAGAGGTPPAGGDGAPGAGQHGPSSPWTAPTEATPGGPAPIPGAGVADGLTAGDGGPGQVAAGASGAVLADGRSTRALAAAPWDEWRPTGLVYLVVVAGAALVLAAPWLWGGKGERA